MRPAATLPFFTALQGSDRELLFSVILVEEWTWTSFGAGETRLLE